MDHRFAKPRLDDQRPGPRVRAHRSSPLAHPSFDEVEHRQPRRRGTPRTAATASSASCRWPSSRGGIVPHSPRLPSRERSTRPGQLQGIQKADKLALTQSCCSRVPTKRATAAPAQRTPSPRTGLACLMVPRKAAASRLFGPLRSRGRTPCIWRCRPRWKRWTLDLATRSLSRITGREASSPPSGGSERLDRVPRRHAYQ